jgi:hypothetical protein
MLRQYGIARGAGRVVRSLPLKGGGSGWGSGQASSTPTRMRPRCRRAQFADLRSDDLQHTIEVFSDIGIPEAQDRHALLLQPFIALTVARPSLSVLPAVEFDSESQCRAIEIENVTAGWMLAAKLRVADLTVSRPMPQPLLNVGDIAPQSAGKLCFPGRTVEAGHVTNPHTTCHSMSSTRRPPPQPSPFQGEGAHRPSCTTPTHALKPGEAP